MGGQNFFLGSKRGARIFFRAFGAISYTFLIKKFSAPSAQFLIHIPIIRSRHIFNHTPGLTGHGNIAREVGCLDLQQGGGGQNFFSNNFPCLRRNFSYTYTIILSQHIFNHTPGLKGHSYIAREVGCLELQQGGPEFFPEGKGGQDFFMSPEGGPKKFRIR